MQLAYIPYMYLKVISFLIIFTLLLTSCNDKKENRIIVQKPEAQEISTIASVDPIAPVDPIATVEESDITKTEGTADGAGGGDHYTQLFWSLMEEVKFRLKFNSADDILTERQIKKISKLIDPDLTTLEFSKEPLYIVVNGKKIAVTALNYKATKNSPPKIVIDESRVESLFSSIREARSLIFHEFLGLANIDDSNYQISSKYFPPRKHPVLYSFTSAQCKYEGFPGQIKDKKIIQKQFFNFFDPSKKDDSKIYFESSETNHTAINDRYDLKPSTFKIAEKILPLYDVSEEKSTHFAVKIKIKLVSGQNSKGHGAYSNRKFYFSGHLLYKLDLLLKNKNGKFKVIGSSSKRIDSFEFNTVYLISNDVLNTQVQQILMDHNIDSQNRNIDIYNKLINSFSDFSELARLFSSESESYILPKLHVFCTLNLDTK